MRVRPTRVASMLGIMPTCVHVVNYNNNATTLQLCRAHRLDRQGGFDPLYGARPLKRAVQQKIENPVARLVLDGKFGPKVVIPVDCANGGVQLRAGDALTRAACRYGAHGSISAASKGSSAATGAIAGR
ncbi:MAG: hypothetical protein IT508_07715 [Burkholderiaceae bacterium]|nr:hypothetical protein [Burkholderiaceae bacterium]